MCLQATRLNEAASKPLCVSYWQMAYVNIANENTTNSFYVYQEKEYNSFGALLEILYRSKTEEKRNVMF